MADPSSIRDLFNQLLQKAQEDNVISNEEQAILDKIELDVDKYEKLLKSALEDDVITQTEAKELTDFRANILDGAWVVADGDSIINSDEAVLLNLLLKLLKKMDLDS